MSVANVTMFEFQTSESIEEFASWYKGHGTYPNNDISLFVRTGETSAIGISVYPTEQDRQNADKLRNESASTCLLYTSPSPRDLSTSRMPSSA